MASPLRVSVIIPTHGRALSLARCLASLARQEFPRDSFEVLVVDDGSEPPVTRALVDAAAPGIALVLLRQAHQGAAAARANGIRHARGETLAFLDDDCTVPPDYLTKIETTFEAHPDTRVAQVGLENPEPSNLYGCAWKFALEQTLTANLHPTADGRQTCGILGGVMAARREVFREVGFDVALRRSREDADLRCQLQARNVPVYYEPAIRVFHHCRSSLPGYLRQIFGYGRGEFHFRNKWTSSPCPVRYVSLTSRRALRSLVRAEKLRRGAAIYGIFWLKRQAGLCGVWYEAVASRWSQGRGTV
jgi:GT2 family glycosyltransferase